MASNNPKKGKEQEVKIYITIINEYVNQGKNCALATWRQRFNTQLKHLKALHYRNKTLQKHEKEQDRLKKDEEGYFTNDILQIKFFKGHLFHPFWILPFFRSFFLMLLVAFKGFSSFHFLLMLMLGVGLKRRRFSKGILCEECEEVWSKPLE